MPLATLLGRAGELDGQGCVTRCTARRATGGNVSTAGLRRRVGWAGVRDTLHGVSCRQGCAGELDGLGCVTRCMACRAAQASWMGRGRQTRQTPAPSGNALL